MSYHVAGSESTQFAHKFFSQLLFWIRILRAIMEVGMKKSLVALLVALLITACVGTSILSIGGAALLNPNGSSPSNSPAQAVEPVSLNTAQADQVAQLQNLIAQYQAREKEYQQREQQLQSQLDQANAEVQSDRETLQQAQMLLTALQQRGLIRITDDGRIFINQ